MPMGNFSFEPRRQPADDMAAGQPSLRHIVALAVEVLDHQTTVAHHATVRMDAGGAINAINAIKREQQRLKRALEITATPAGGAE